MTTILATSPNVQSKPITNQCGIQVESQKQALSRLRTQFKSKNNHLNHAQECKDRRYWVDEISFLESRLNGSQGDIDKEDRAACEDALKAAKENLDACP